MKIAISAESTIDMPKDLLQKFDIHTVPFTVIIGDEVHLDGEFENTKILCGLRQQRNRGMYIICRCI